MNNNLNFQINLTIIIITIFNNIFIHCILEQKIIDYIRKRFEIKF